MMPRSFPVIPAKLAPAGSKPGAGIQLSDCASLNGLSYLLMDASVRWHDGGDGMMPHSFLVIPAKLAPAGSKPGAGIHLSSCTSLNGLSYPLMDASVPGCVKTPAICHSETLQAPRNLVVH